MGDGAQLGHASSLHVGQAVPAGERWHGSPAQRTEVEYRSGGAGPLRQPAQGRLHGAAAAQRAGRSTCRSPVGGLVMLLTAVPQLGAILDPATLARHELGVLRSTPWSPRSCSSSASLRRSGSSSSVTVPRVLNLSITPDKVYPLYGFHYSVHRTIARLTNLKVFAFLFGDSSYIVSYLRLARLRPRPTSSRPGRTSASG